MILPHAINRCMERRQCSKPDAIERILSIARAGAAYDNPNGKAISIGSECIGVFRPTFGDYTAADHLAVTTYYHYHLRPNRTEIATPLFCNKPGRTKASATARRQGRHWKHRENRPSLLH